MRNIPTVILSMLVAAGCATRNFVVDPAIVCRCDAGIDTPCRSSAERWRLAIENQLEMAAADFKRGEGIGTECESEGDNWWTNVWKPVDGFNHTLVGTFHHFNWNYDDDEDWNIHVIPDAAFSELISRVEELHEESIDNHIRCGEPPCMEAEISPDKQLWSNPWFFAPGAHPDDTDDNGFSVLEGRKMGFYGPWVVDANHDSKSEIHPVPMIWWKDHFAGGFDGSGPVDVFWLMLMQDNTGRFDDRDNFDCGGAAPAGWEPWTHSPVSGEFSIAFEADPAGPLVTFSINEIFSRFVMTGQDVAARRDADDGTTHDLEFDGRVLVSVQEDQPRDNDLGVTFTDLCLRPDGKLQGFVSIRSKVGRNDDIDEEGFHVLYVARALRSRPAVPHPTRPVLDGFVLTSKEVGESIRGEGRYFAGDIELSLSGSTDPVFGVELAADGVRKKIPFTQDSRSRRVLLRNLPLTNGRIHVTTASGKTSSLPIATLSPNPRIQENVVGREAVQERELKLSTRYAPFRGNELSDRQSTFAAFINEALSKQDSKKLETLFHAAQPLTTAWKFEAINLKTGEAVPVHSGEGASVRVEVHPGSFGDETVRVHFPPETAGVIEVRARATVTDANGQSVTIEHRFRSARSQR